MYNFSHYWLGPLILLSSNRSQYLHKGKIICNLNQRIHDSPTLQMFILRSKFSGMLAMKSKASKID